MKYLLVLIFALITTFAYTQNVGIGTTTPNASAVLDVNSFNKGFLPPRMSYGQITAIPSPAPGLIIYNTTFNKPVYFDSLKWRFFNDTLMQPKIGDRLFGGIVFYIDPSGQHGFVAAETDQSNGISWWNVKYVLTGAFSSSDGATNTTAIINFQGNTGSYAAKICKDYRGGGYTDWYLPARDQLNLLKGQKYLIGMSDDIYWSSTEVDISRAWDQYMFTGESLQTNKNILDHVRAVRSF